MQRNEGLDAIEAKRKIEIKSYITAALDSYFWAVTEGFKHDPQLAIKAFEAMRHDFIPPIDKAEFKKHEVLNCINIVRRIFKHECPQNRAAGNGAAFDREVLKGDDPRSFVQIEGKKTGVYKGMVYYFKNIKGIAKEVGIEPQGILSLTANMASIGKEEIVECLNKLIDEAIVDQKSKHWVQEVKSNSHITRTSHSNLATIGLSHVMIQPRKKLHMRNISAQPVTQTERRINQSEIISTENERQQRTDSSFIVNMPNRTTIGNVSQTMEDEEEEKISSANLQMKPVFKRPSLQGMPFTSHHNHSVSSRFAPLLHSEIKESEMSEEKNSVVIGSENEDVGHESKNTKINHNIVSVAQINLIDTKQKKSSLKQTFFSNPEKERRRAETGDVPQVETLRARESNVVSIQENSNDFSSIQSVAYQYGLNKFQVSALIYLSDDGLTVGELKKWNKNKADFSLFHMNTLIYLMREIHLPVKSAMAAVCDLSEVDARIIADRTDQYSELGVVKHR